MKLAIEDTGMYRGKQRGYYDPSAIEVFFTKLGQEIFKVTDNKTHKTQMTDEDWILHCNTAGKCVRFGTVWGPKSLNDFTLEEKQVLKKFIKANSNE